MIICLDTHVLIWGIRGQAERGQEVMIGRTRILLEALAEKAKANQIVVPAPLQRMRRRIGDGLMVAVPSRRKSVFRSRTQRAKR